jgi:hypothetical protein
MTGRNRMANGRTGLWETLEKRSPRLFLLGGVLILIFALHNGQVFLTDTTFKSWIYPTVILGRLSVFLGIAGLSVRVVHRSPRFGKPGRVVVAVAVVSAIGLLALGILAQIGVSTPIIAVFGIGTAVLTVITYALFGVAIIRTGAFSTLIGGLLLVAVVPILTVFFGRFVLPVRLLGAVSESTLFVIFVVIAYFLRTEFAPTDRAGPTGDTTTR